MSLMCCNVNRPPVLPPITALSAMEGYYFSYNISASDPDSDQLTYSDDCPLFDINPFTGGIGFVPAMWAATASTSLSATALRLYPRAYHLRLGTPTARLRLSSYSRKLLWWAAISRSR